MTHEELDRYIREELDINWSQQEPGIVHDPPYIDLRAYQERRSAPQGPGPWSPRSFWWRQPNPLFLVFPNPQSDAPWHTHEYYELMYVYEGAVTHRLARGTVTVPQGGVLIVPPGAYHEVAASPGAISFNLILTRRLLSAGLQEQLRPLPVLGAFFAAAQPEPLLLDCGGSAGAGFYLRELLCQTYDPDGYAGQAIGLLLPLWFTALERAGGAAAPGHSPQGIDDDIDRVLQYIDANYATATLAEAAARFGYTPAYISRALKRATGQSFLQLRQTRCMVRAAALLLAEPDCAVTAVAERVGIRNVTQFYRLFSQRYEMTPREYRRRFEER